MCEPLSAGTMFAISTAVAAAGAGLSYMGQQAQASAQADANAAQAESVRKATINQYDQLQLQQQQDRENAAQKLTETSRQAAQARATAITAAGEAGVAGLSVNALLDDITRQEMEFTDSVKHNQQRRDQQIRQEMVGVEASGQSRINSLPTPQQPSFAEALLRTGSGAFDSYSRYLKIKE